MPAGSRKVVETQGRDLALGREDGAWCLGCIRLDNRSVLGSLPSVPGSLPSVPTAL
jgi:hypothetical protein